MKSVLQDIIDLRQSIRCPLVAVSGIDGSGKTYWAAKLADRLTQAGLQVAVIPLDLFLNPPEVRFSNDNRGKHFYERGFDLQRAFAELITPLHQQRRIDITLPVRRLPQDELARQRFRYDGVDVILLEGNFLLKNTVRERFDYRVWVDCSFLTARQRVANRIPEGPVREQVLRDYEDVYFVAQKQHLVIDEPKTAADCLLVNDPVLEQGPAVLLKELVTQGTLAPQLRWLHEPDSWEIEGQTLRLRPDAQSDFWQRTHYGFENDNGHFLYLETASDFLMRTHVRLRPAHQFDQAGLMVRLDAHNWLKTSVEYQLEKPASLGAVLTNLGYSDWSIQSVSEPVSCLWFRIEREGRDFVVDVSLDGSNWQRIRVCRLHQATETVQCGLYACSPIDAGFEAQFEQLKIEQLIL